MASGNTRENNSYKKTTNFHSIADLMKSDARSQKTHTQDISPTRQQPSQRPSIQTISQHDGLSIMHSDTQPERNFSRSESMPFIITTQSHDRNQRPPSLTPPTTPTPEDNSSSSLKLEDTVTGNCKKARTIYKTQQVYVLEQIFSQTHYPDPELIESLSMDLGISEHKIKVWFQNKRARWRRKSNDPAPVNPSKLPSMTPHHSIPGVLPHLPGSILGFIPTPSTPGSYPIPGLPSNGFSNIQIPQQNHLLSSSLPSHHFIPHLHSPYSDQNHPSMFSHIQQLRHMKSLSPPSNNLFSSNPHAMRMLTPLGNITNVC